MSKRISDAQAKALRDVAETGNFGLHVRFITKDAVCGRRWVETGVRHPLRLTALGRAALETWVQQTNYGR